MPGRVTRVAVAVISLALQPRPRRFVGPLLAVATVLVSLILAGVLGSGDFGGDPHTCIADLLIEPAQHIFNFLIRCLFLFFRKRFILLV